MEISVIIPVYNAKLYLEECVQSILKQTFSKFELILVNDGSKDDSGEICDQLAKTDSRIKVIHKENGGSNSARNAGLKSACGEYVCYVDCDDLLREDALQKLYTYAQENDLDMAVAELACFTGAFTGKEAGKAQKIPEGILDKEGMKRDFYPQMLFRKEFCFGAMPTLCAKLFKKELLMQNQFLVDERIWMGEDGAITYPCFLDAQKIGYLKGEGLYFYRMLPTSLTHKKKKTYFGDKILILCHYLDKRFLEKAELYENLKEQLLRYMLYLTDSMFMVHGMAALFKNKQFFEQVQLLAKDELGAEMVQVMSKTPTSSRARRLLKVFVKPSLKNRMEYALFLQYEKMSGFLRGLKK